MVVGGVPREGKVGFVAESPPVEGALKRDDVCVLCAPPAAGAVVPKSGLGALSALVVGVVESAGLLTLPNRPPPVLGAAGVVDGVPPNRGFEAPDAAPPAPKSPPEDCCWEVVGVVVDGAADDVGVVEEAAFNPPKRLGVLDPGGGPAGVVEVLPNKEPPAGAGVADEAAFPNKVPPVAVPPPNSPLVAVCPDVVDSVVLAGV